MGVSDENMPTTEIGTDLFTDGKIAVADLLVATKLAPSKGEARRLIQQGGVTVDDEKISDTFASLDEADFDKGHVIIRKGKKVFHKAVLKK
jgi:tyrosyl-tRNA synthetase